MAYSDSEAFPLRWYPVLHESRVLTRHEFLQRTLTAGLHQPVIIPRIGRPHLSVQLPAVYPLHSTKKKKKIIVVSGSSMLCLYEFISPEGLRQNLAEKKGRHQRVSSQLKLPCCERCSDQKKDKIKF